MSYLLINHIKKSDILYYDIESSKILKYLNSEKPEYLKDYEWKLLINEAQDAFAKKVPSCLELSFYYERKVEDFFKIEKPKHFQQTKWNEILEKLHKLYVFHLKEVAVDISYFEDAANIYKKLKAKNRYDINKKDWGEYLAILKNVYLFCLVKGLCRQHDNFIDYLNQYDLTVIDGSESEFLEETAYKFQHNIRYHSLFTIETANNFLKSAKAEWIKERDYKDLKATAKDVVHLYTEKAKNNSIKSLLDQILFRQTLSQDKPTEITDEEWEQIKKLEKDMIQLLSENKEILSKNEEVLTEIHQKEKSIPNLIEKLNFQLSIINEILSDPTVLERIEDYNNKFSPGNFQNLRKIASYLKKTREA